MKISPEQTETRDKGEFAAQFYLQKKDNHPINFLVVHCRTGHYKTRFLGAFRYYYVLEGAGVFTIDDKADTAHPGDLFIIQRNQIYSYEGQMKLLEMNAPPTDKSNEERLD